MPTAENIKKRGDMGQLYRIRTMEEELRVRYRLMEKADKVLDDLFGELENVK